MNSFGVLGDLCKEAEWMRRRIKCARRSIQHCQHPQLKDRLVAEISSYRARCLVMKASLTSISCSLESQSTQKYLLEELLSRCLLTAQLSFHLS